MHDVFVGRQPIYTRQLDVFAYELLFRSGEVQQASFVDGTRATATVLVNAFVEIGLDTIVGAHTPALVNFTRDFLLQDYAAIFPPDRVVLEILENVTVDDDLIAAMRRLSAQGYRFALDDFIYHDHLQPLVELADLVKLDVHALDRTSLEAHVARLRPYAVKLVAEKVETQEVFRYCYDLGFEYFQGYFLCQPDVVKGQRRSAQHVATLSLLAKLQDPEIDIRELENLISPDASLSYNLLRVANAAFYRRRFAVESIQQAILRLGLRFIANMVSLFCLANVDDKPHELLVTAMIRAKMCEQLAHAMEPKRGNTFFTVGLLSVLDVLLDQPMDEILNALPLTEDIARALLGYEGTLGAALRCVMAYERGYWHEVTAIGLESEIIVKAYLDALAWAIETSGLLKETGP